MTQTEQTNIGAPDQEEVVRITNAVVDALGECDLESALTVVCNIAGQLVAALSDGKPAEAQRHMQSVAANISKAATTKMFADAEKRKAH